MKVSFDPLAVITRHGLSDGGAIITLEPRNNIYYSAKFVKVYQAFEKWRGQREIIDDTGPAL